MDVDEPGSDHFARGIDELRIARILLDNDAVRDEKIADLIHPVGGVDHAASFDVH